MIPVAAALLAGLTLGAFAPREAAAQGRDQVCVYENADYGGWEKCFSVGDSLSDLGRLHDSISSIRIRGRAQITLFEHENFQGRQVEISSDVPNLGRWNDQADSLRVKSGGGGGGGFGGGYRDRDRDDDRRDSRRSYDDGRRSSSRGNDRVCFYEDAGFRGRSECWDLGDDVRDLRNGGWNDRISSVRIFGRIRVALFEDINFAGQRLVIDNDLADLSQQFDGRNSWNDRVSSFRISNEGRGR